MNRREFFALLGGMSAGDMLNVQKAYWLAKNAHHLQTHSGKRYFEHPKEVAATVIGRGYRSPEIIIAALLHDVVEDTYTPPHVIVSLFGHDTWRDVATLSKYVPVFDPVTGEMIGRYKKPTEQYFSELSAAPMHVRLVKLADRRHNISSMDDWDAERKKKYGIETREYLIPIAHNTDTWFAQELTALADKACAVSDPSP